MNDATLLPTALVADEISNAHDTGPGHPECAARFDAVVATLRRAPFFGLRPGLTESGSIGHDRLAESGSMASSLLHVKPRAATWEELALCHSKKYIELVEREIAACGRSSERVTMLSTGDTHISRRSLEPALHAAGGACVAVDALFAGKAKNAFCVHRPPGHHAAPDKGMGFCLFNNAAVAARYAQAKYNIGKVLIVDWDVHHGNGTQDVFYDDPSVLFFSTHQSPWYPGTGLQEETGRGKGVGTNMNRPLPAGSGRREIFAAFEDDLAPAVDRFQPELVVISAGFDSRVDDPLGNFLLTDDDFADLTALVMKMADDHAGGRVISVLEGGYNLEGLASAATAHCARLVEG